ICARHSVAHSQFQLKCPRGVLKLRRNSPGRTCGGLQPQEHSVMVSKLSLIPVALIALGGARLASAANYDEGQWVTTFMAGSGFIENGSFNRTMSTTSADVGTAILDQMQFRDAFRAGPSFSVETGFMAQSNLEPFARLSYSQLRGRNDEIGVVDSPLLTS